MSKIPQSKHSDKELSELRARSAMQSSQSPIVAIYQGKLAHKATVVLGYILSLTSPTWASVKVMTKDTAYSMTDFYIMSIPIVLALLIALWIGLKRALSRHNAAFIFILALFCCFPIVYAVNTDKNFEYELFSLIGVEPSVPEPDLSTDTESPSSSLSSDEVRELLEKETERIQAENRERLLEAESRKVESEN